MQDLTDPLYELFWRQTRPILRKARWLITLGVALTVLYGLMLAFHVYLLGVNADKAHQGPLYNLAQTWIYQWRMWRYFSSGIWYGAMVCTVVVFQLCVEGLRLNDDLLASFSRRDIAAALLKLRTRLALWLFPGLLGTGLLLFGVITIGLNVRYQLISQAQGSSAASWEGLAAWRAAAGLAANVALIFALGSFQVSAATFWARSRQVSLFSIATLALVTGLGLSSALNLLNWYVLEDTLRAAIKLSPIHWQIAFQLVCALLYLALARASLLLAQKFAEPLRQD